LPFCPFHPEGGCGFARHTPYEQVDPPGCLIARWYCRLATRTISLLPDLLCSRLPGVLADVEAVVAVEAAPSREAASETVRPDIELPGALRWIRRRAQLVHAGLAAAIGLLPTLLVGYKPTVTSVRLALGAEVALVRLRLELLPHLAALPPPLGFGPRPWRRSYKRLEEKGTLDYAIPGSTRVRVAPETIRDWLKSYRKGSFEALKPRARGDQGQSRALSREVADLLLSIKDENPDYPVQLVIRDALGSGKIPEGLQLAPSTVHWLLSRAGLMAKAEAPTSKDHLRFEFEKAGDLWRSDVTRMTR